MPRPKHKKPTGPTVSCPGCGGKQPERSADAIYWCDKCRCQFDDAPDEGGTHHSDPSKRLEYQEWQKSRGKR